MAHAQEIQQPAMMTSMSVSEELNCYSALIQAPYIISSLGHLLLISAERDFSLEHFENAKKLKRLTYTHSFRACLVQVFNGVYQTFNNAHNSMNRIRMKSINIDQDLKKAVKFILQGSKDDLAIAARFLESIEKKSNECAHEAELITEEFEELALTMNELIEVLTEAEGGYNQKQNDAVLAHDAATTKKKLIEEEQKRIEKKREEKNREKESAEMIHNEAMHSQPPTLKILLYGFMDGITSLFQSFVRILPLEPVVPIPSVPGDGRLGLSSGPAHDNTQQVGRFYTRMLLKDVDKQRQEAKEKLESCNEEFSRCQEELRQQSTRMEEIQDELAQFKHKSLDIKKINGVLSDGREQLSKLINNWRQFERIFVKIRDEIKENLTEQLTRFSATASDRKATNFIMRRINPQSFTCNRIVEESNIASQFVYIVNSITSVYVKISEDLLQSELFSLQGIVAFNPARDHTKMDEMREQLDENCKKARDKILKILDEKKREIELEIRKRSDKLTEIQ